jgi:hypothetical protein
VGGLTHQEPIRAGPLVLGAGLNSGMQVEIRSHIAQCLRDYPDGGEGVITLAGSEARGPLFG